MRLGYSPFGQVYRKHNDRTFWKLNSGVNANNQLNALMPYQYTGRYTEAATGLVHLDARWYNPHTQRFVQPDLWNFRNTGLPAEIQHELMRFTGLDTNQLLRDPSQQVAYGYVSGNPLAWTDWLGLSSCEVPKMTPEERRQFFAFNDVNYNNITEFQEYMAGLLESPDGISQIRDATPAYAETTDMGIIVREQLGTAYLNRRETSIAGMAQNDGQKIGMIDLAELAVSITPTSRKKIDLVQSALNFASEIEEMSGPAELTNEDILTFYGSQLND